MEHYISNPNFRYLIANKGMLTEKEAEQICLDNVLGYASGLSKAIKDGDLVTMRRHARRPESYMESFARCAARMMKVMDEKEKEPEQARGSVQLSLFRSGMEMGQHR